MVKLLKKSKSSHCGVQYWFALTGLVCCLFFSGNAIASENERYQAIRTSPSGPILIIDTQEGHLWTWSNKGIEETDIFGVNPRIRYQGNVRKNMKSPITLISPSGSEKNRF